MLIFSASLSHKFKEFVKIMKQWRSDSKPLCTLSPPLQRHGILKWSVLDVRVVGCLLSRMRPKFRKLHVENPLFKTGDGVPFQIDGHLECCGVAAAQVWRK